MDMRTEVARLALGPRESMLLDHAAGVEVIAHTGCLWLTQHGDSRDIVLGPGQSFTLGDSADVLITSARGAEFMLRSSPSAPSAAAGWRRRIAGWFEVRAGGRVRLHPVA